MSTRSDITEIFHYSEYALQLPSICCATKKQNSTGDIIYLLFIQLVYFVFISGYFFLYVSNLSIPSKKLIFGYCYCICLNLSYVTENTLGKNFSAAYEPRNFSASNTIVLISSSTSELVILCVIDKSC